MTNIDNNIDTNIDSNIDNNIYSNTNNNIDNNIDNNINNNNVTNNNIDKNNDNDKKDGVKLYNVETLKHIEKTLNNMNPDNLKQIYQIIKKNDEKFTKKKDHILINLGSLKESTIHEILSFLSFLKNNQQILLEDEIKKNEFKNKLNAK